VIGFPGETITDMTMTVVFAERMRSLDAMPFCFIATPYYGTRLYNISKKYGHMQEQDGSAFEYKLLNMDPMIETEDFTKQDLLYYRSLIRSEPETTEIINLLKKRPLDTLRCFSAHPALITKYIARRMLT